MKLPTSTEFRKSAYSASFRTAVECTAIQMALCILRHEIGTPRDIIQPILAGQPGFAEFQAHRRSWEQGYNAALDHFIAMGNEPPADKKQAELFAAYYQRASDMVLADCPPTLVEAVKTELAQGRPADA